MHLRVAQIFWEEMKGDTSFQEKENFLSLLFRGTKYSQIDMRETWNSGIKHGIEIGLNRASIEGQKIELNNNIKEARHAEFIEKFYKLAEEYNCAIQYHPKIGMVVIDQNINTF